MGLAGIGEGHNEIHGGGSRRCGPCKIIAPKYQELSEKYLDVVFLKLDCNQENKQLAKELSIRVVPTFKVLKHNKTVKEVTGAKFDDLVAAIEMVRSS
ncbi:Thioredoxin F-type [Hibiscus syriacus]|uniref:Thioredoxin F-type n=1 Tax=Hibiscus syriacus TaxID=106335 RepID=A0A6A3AFZ0_HIBSY|nr:Thioredoxin F-type [Hibiscus syriacus]